MPRRSGFGEAIDDHQVAFANRLHMAGMVELLENRPVCLALSDREPSAPHDEAAGASLCRDLREYLVGTLGPA
jgi:UDP-N-acetylglucosamine transferase subunit ALG13